MNKPNYLAAVRGAVRRAVGPSAAYLCARCETLTVLGLPRHAVAADTGCKPKEPHKYIVYYSILRADGSLAAPKDAVGTLCLEREIKTNADWDWLKRRMEERQGVSTIVLGNVIPYHSTPSNGAR